MGSEKSGPCRSRREAVAVWARKENVRDNLIVSGITTVGLIVVSTLSAVVLPPRTCP